MRHVVRRGVLGVVALTMVTVGLSACVGQSNAGVSCAWGNVSNGDLLNVAYPDASATYFTTKYQLTPGQQMILSGTYPFARYMSLHTYTLTGAAVDHLADVSIAADAGSDNPFTNAAASTDPAQRRWTVSISADTSPGSGTSYNALAAGSAPGSVANGSVILRVYVPDTAGDLQGGVALPAMAIRNIDGTVTPVPTCAGPTPDGSVIDLINTFGPATDVPATDPPVFKRPVTVVGLYPNQDNAYLAAIAGYQPGKVVVIRGKSPTTPDTRNGVSPTVPSQLRYWSLCSNEYRKPYPVTDCGFDHQIPVDANGFYTVVISTVAERPANALIGNGVYWLNWGNTSVDMVIGMRHMLPEASFTEAVQNLGLGQLAVPQMGAYAPVAATCSISTFESGGYTACGL